MQSEDPQHQSALTPGSLGSIGSSQQISRFARSGPACEPGFGRFKPGKDRLIAGLCKAGATVRAYAGNKHCCCEIEVPSNLPETLLVEIENRGWRVIQGGKPNPEAEHDSWLVGVPLKELE